MTTLWPSRSDKILTANSKEREPRSQLQTEGTGSEISEGKDLRI
jgi:hypothetical protein